MIWPEMTWNDMKWYVIICGDLMGFDGIWCLFTSCFYMLQRGKKSKKCQVGGPGGLPFYSPQKLRSVRGSNFLGACSPTGYHKAKARKGTVEAASAASVAETAVPNFIAGICDDMVWNDMKWYVMICGDLMGFEKIWWGLMVSSIVLLHASSKNNKIEYVKKMSGGCTLTAAIL